MSDKCTTCKLCDNVFEHDNQKFGLSGVYKRQYEPWQLLEGKRNSLVWIYGINQAFNEGEYDLDYLLPRGKKWKKIELDGRSLDKLEDCFIAKNGKEKVFKNEKYFKKFNTVSPILFELLGQDYGVAHTDVIRCGSVRHKPEVMIGKLFEDIVTNYSDLEGNEQKIIKDSWNIIPEKIRKNCKKYVEQQLNSSNYEVPRLIICHGNPASKTIREILLSEKEQEGIARLCKMSKIDYVPFYHASLKKGDKQHSITVVQMEFMHDKLPNVTKRSIGYLIDGLIKDLGILETRDKLLGTKSNYKHGLLV
ncbi:hypothetical protein [Bacillus pinisoli]|uniref:hypothetical protein n=1 Tax=Bacillus pinisoli TaxID=2901866 RepID=UPI001FF4494C|nr:hypothetical protein [Bacillus pinisoli]